MKKIFLILVIVLLGAALFSMSNNAGGNSADAQPSSSNVGVQMSAGPFLSHPELTAGYERANWQRLSKSSAPGALDANAPIHGVLDANGTLAFYCENGQANLNLNEKQVQPAEACGYNLLLWREGQRVWYATR
ncbi:MAG: hypothetical protein A2418_00595 [Candidatus Brennerbacteria bacterium RIFOXYC1_FULL_41_11]|nr:MAG: hypothetical protein A2418_00595 [Candidatus Brennerbacteria bacterium RIFOXYC1_FULL_41_11]